MHQVVQLRAKFAAFSALLIIALFVALSAGTENFSSAQDATPDGYQAYRLQYIAPDNIAAQLNTILAGKAEVVVDRRSSRVLIRGSQEAHRLAVETIRALDVPAPDSSRMSSTLQQTTVRAYLITQQQRNNVATELRLKYRPLSSVSISIDDRTGQILVAAPATIQNEIVQWLKSRNLLTQPPASHSPAVRGNFPGSGSPYQLRHITWRELEASFRRLFGQLPLRTTDNGQLAILQLPKISGVSAVLKVDRLRDQIEIEAPENITKPWEKIVWALDSPRQNSTQQTQLVPLNRANPANVHRAVSLIRTAAENSRQQRPSLLINGQNRDRPANLISMIFQPNNQGANQPAQNNRAPANNPAVSNQPNQNGNNNIDGALIGDVRIEFVPELGIFIIRGNDRDVKRVLKIIEDIERQSIETEPEIEIYQLRHANSIAVAEMVNELYEQVFAPRQGQVTITALVKPNALLLIGRRENMGSVIGLIQKLDQPVTSSAQIQIFPLRHMSAVDAEEKITTFYEEREGLDTRVRVISDFRTNSLIVQASPRDLAEVKHLLNSIDVDTAPAVSELRIFQLKNSISAELAPVLQEAISGQATTAAPQQQAAGTTQAVARARSVILQYIALDSQGNKILESGLLSDVQITADANSNALIVRGPAKSMDLIEAVIQALDQLPAAEAQIKVFPIINGDATNLQFVLQTLFGQTTTGQGAFGQGGIQQTALQAVSAGENSLVALRFAVDLRTNTVIAAGSTSDLEVVEAIIARLDEADIESRKTVVYRLKNAPSDDVANALTNLLQRQTQVQQIGITQQLVSPFEQIEREVIVVSEPVTNSLIISATPRYYDQIRTVIEELDVRPPMVMIQVIIAEVTFDDAFELGAEFGLQDSLLFDRGLASVGFPFNNQPLGNDFTAAARATRNEFAGQALSHFSLGRTNPTLGYGGMVLSAANESISVLIRALKDKGRVEILSRPQIMTLDNQAAFIQVGARVPRIVNSNITPQGGTQNTVQDVDVGLLLRVQPRISPDGLIVMLLDVEKSEVGPIAQGIPVAVDNAGNVILSPQINTTTAQTTISARSGQTVILAGLITKSETVITRGVPYLSDIPILGRLFRFDSEINQRTELLIIMTPYIVEDDEDVEFIKAMESERMSWSLADVSEIHGNVGLRDRFGDMQSFQPMVIYPDEDPTGEGETINSTGIQEVKPTKTPSNQSSRRSQNDIDLQRSAMKYNRDITSSLPYATPAKHLRAKYEPSSTSGVHYASGEIPGSSNRPVSPAGFQQPLPNFQAPYTPSDYQPTFDR